MVKPHIFLILLQEAPSDKSITFSVLPLAHLHLLWLKREKNTQQVIHCSIVLLYMTPGSWDILDVLEL